MRHVFIAAALVTAGLQLPLFAQYPGGYPPGGGYPSPGRYPTGPGIPVPRRSKDKKPEKQSQPQLQSLSGVLRHIDDTSVVILAPDSRTVIAKRSDRTKFYKKGVESAASTLTLGDHVRVDASQDEQGYYHAVAVYVDSEASPQERAAAEAADTRGAQKPDTEEGAPPLRRKSDQRSEPPTADSDGEQPRVTPAVITAPDIPSELDPDRPRTRRGKPPTRKSEEPAEDDSAPAQAPATRPRVATNRSPADTMPRDEPGPREEPRLVKAREVVAARTESLPNYFCQEQITRYASTTPKVDWRPLDIVSATVVYENGRDRYRDLKINGKPVDKKMEEIGGAWSTGEFGMIAADLFSPATAAHFTKGGTARISGHDAAVYDFEVDREHSHWHIQAPSQSMRPAYKGSVWLDQSTSEILRIEMQTDRMPKEFPLDKVESAVDYEDVRIGEHRFLLPVHAETLTCIRGTNNCSRNVIDFRNYRMYSSESTITFDK